MLAACYYAAKERNLLPSISDLAHFSSVPLKALDAMLVKKSGSADVKAHSAFSASRMIWSFNAYRQKDFVRDYCFTYLLFGVVGLTLRIVKFAPFTSRCDLIGSTLLLDLCELALRAD